MEMFYNHKYRHLLRSRGDYQRWKGIQKPPTQRWWDGKLRQIEKAFKKAGLDPDGFSEKHTTILAKLIREDVTCFVRAFHDETPIVTAADIHWHE